MKLLSLSVIKLYKLAVSPYWPGTCKYQPTCSDYALEAIDIYGSWKGISLVIRRIARCVPMCVGGYDPVPVQNSDNSSDLEPRTS